MITSDIDRPPSQPTAPLRPHADLPAWTARLRDAEIPVLAATAEALEAMREREDAIDANALGELIAGDPLMTLKVLAHAAAHRSPRAVTDVETVTAAIVMMGIPPFFRAFAELTTVEARLAAHPQAAAALEGTLERAHRAANFALAFAVHRMDHDAAVMHTAALLHDFAEMLLCCHAPVLAAELHARLQTEPGLRSRVAQREALGIELVDLQQALMHAWRLPELLIHVSDDRKSVSPEVQTVALAVRLARHSTAGWDDPALPDDYTAIAGLLNLSIEATQELVLSV